MEKKEGHTMKKVSKGAIIPERLEEAIEKSDSCSSLKDLSERTGISYSTIAKYSSSATTPPLDRLLLIAQTLDCSIDYLVGNAPDIYGSEKSAVAEYLGLDIFAVDTLRKLTYNAKAGRRKTSFTGETVSDFFRHQSDVEKIFGALTEIRVFDNAVHTVRMDGIKDENSYRIAMLSSKINRSNLKGEAVRAFGNVVDKMFPDS